jgi:hypothetical protein
MRRLTRAEIDDAERGSAEGQALPIGHGAIRERALVGPLFAEHRPQDLLLGRIIAANHLGNTCRREDRHVGTLEDRGQGTVVVGVRMRDQHREQALAGRRHEGAEGVAVGDTERAVDRHHAVWNFDEVRVDGEQAGAKAMNDWGAHGGSRPPRSLSGFNQNR